MWFYFVCTLCINKTIHLSSSQSYTNMKWSYWLRYPQVFRSFKIILIFTSADKLCCTEKRVHVVDSKIKYLLLRIGNAKKSLIKKMQWWKYTQLNGAIYGVETCLMHRIWYWLLPRLPSLVSFLFCFYTTVVTVSYSVLYLSLLGGSFSPLSLLMINKNDDCDVDDENEMNITMLM